MQDEDRLKELIEKHTVFKYVGPGYVIGIPARDLTEADLAGIWEREGLTEVEIMASGLYVRAEVMEIEPFCGVMTSDGKPCSRKVARWGDFCYQHKEEENGTEGIP